LALNRLRPRAAILPLRGRIAINEFYHGHGGRIPEAYACPQHAAIATLPRLVPIGDLGKQLRHNLLIADLGKRLTAGMQPPPLAERDDPLDIRAKFLRLRQRRRDLLVLQKRRSHVAKHRNTMGGGDAELTPGNSVTHE